MYNDPSVNVSDRPFVTLCTINVLYFFNLFFWIKAWSVFSLFVIINTKETSTSTLKLLNNCFSAYVYKKWKNIEVQSNIQLGRHGSHVVLLKARRFMVLIFLHLLISVRCSTDYKGSLLTRYNRYPSLKRVTKTFLEKVQRKSATC